MKVEMTSRERILAVMSGRMPDRPPWMEFGFHTDIASKLIGRKLPRSSSGFHPNEDIEKYNEEIDALIEAAHMVGLDTVWLKHWSSSFADFSKDRSDEGGTIKTLKDWQEAVQSTFDLKESVWYRCVDIFVEKVRKTTDLAMGFTANLCFESALQAIGFRRFCMAIYDSPQLLETVLDWYVVRNRQVVRDFFKYDPDIIVLGDDVAFKSGPFVSPQVFREVFLPRMKLVAQECVIPWVYHSDGNIMPIMEDLLSLGMAGLHPIEPHGTMDIVEVKTRFGDRVFPVGNLDMEIVANGSIEDIDEAVRELFESVGYDGRWIMSCSNSIDSGANIENLLAISKTLSQLKY
jgi:uroporphyrinogen decarboxylase